MDEVEALSKALKTHALVSCGENQITATSEDGKHSESTTVPNSLIPRVLDFLRNPRDIELTEWSRIAGHVKDVAWAMILVDMRTCAPPEAGVKMRLLRTVLNTQNFELKKPVERKCLPNNAFDSAYDNAYDIYCHFFSPKSPQDSCPKEQTES